MFSLRNVRYKDILNIKKLDIPEKTVTCIVGESGSGKTTLLKLLNNLISCDEGEILFHDKPIDDIDSLDLRRRVVMLSQSPAIYDGSVRDNLLKGLSFSEKPLVKDGKLIEILGMVHLSADLEKNADKLSGGEKQRLTLARVLLMEPDVFLLDEPSSALDEDTELFITDRLVSYVKSNGKTLIMVTHSKKIASVFSENTIEIRNGEIT